MLKGQKHDMVKWTVRLLFMSLAHLFALTAHAQLPLPARFSAHGYASDYTVGKLDLLVPMAGNYAHNLYLDPTLNYATNNQGTADLGLGYRWVQNNAAILGGYLFGSYNRIANNARLWVANPGIEALGSRWDAHLNAYLVMGDRNAQAGSYIGTETFFQKHSQFSPLYAISQHAGHGADAQLGYQLFPQSSFKGYIGSYFFAPSQTANIWGGAAGLEYWLHQNVKIFAGYTYDNVYHSTGALGLGIEFGGTRVHHYDPTLAERITDPVAHDLAELGRGSGIPSRETVQRMVGPNSIQMPGVGPVEEILDNIVFFSGTGETAEGVVTLDDCTFEEPCSGGNFNQETVDMFTTLFEHPGTMFYAANAVFTALDEEGTGPLTLHENQFIESRTADYTELAPKAQRSIFRGGFNLLNNSGLDDVIVLPDPEVSISQAVLVNNSVNTTVIGSDLGSPDDPYFIGVTLQGNNAQTDVTDAVIFADSQGINIKGGRATVTNPVITLTEGTYAVAASGNASVDIFNGNINLSNDTAASLRGIYVKDQANVRAYNTSITVTNYGAGPVSVLYVLGSNASISFTNGGILSGQSQANNVEITTGTNIYLNDSIKCFINTEEADCIPQ
jgi:hypothetical protein